MSNDLPPFVPLLPYPATGTPDPLRDNVDLNKYYQAGNLAWVLVSTGLVFLMIPGAGFFYSGLARRKSALSLILQSMLATAVVSFQWFFWGYSLTYSHKAGRFIGNLDNFAFINVLGAPSVVSDAIPDLLFAVYQGMFSCTTVALAVGATAERGRVLPCVVFMFVWATLIYDPIACWTWNPSGWSHRLGDLDFAGGTPVHIASGSAALAYSLMLGTRAGELNYPPHNASHIVLGTVLLWVGWFGFNGGSALSANLRATMACVVTNISASVGGITWCLLDYRNNVKQSTVGKWSTVGFCSGVVAGLVAITPGSGFVPAWAAVFYGVASGAICNYATHLKFVIGVDDTLDIFAIHGVGGLVGNVLTGFFASDYIAALDGTSLGKDKIAGGWVNQHWAQLGIQLAASVAGMAYAFGGTCIILWVMNSIPGLGLRVGNKQEKLGIDDAELGEFAYDYVDLRREISYTRSEDVINGVSGLTNTGLDEPGQPELNQPELGQPEPSELEPGHQPQPSELEPSRTSKAYH